jgi:hypothetical protein
MATSPSTNGARDQTGEDRVVVIALRGRDGWTAAGLALLVVLAGIGRLAPGACGLFHDDGIYLSTAKSLAEGTGYRLINLPEVPVQTKYPILYPALLAVVWKLWPVFPDNLLAMKALTLLSGAATVGGTYLYLVRFDYASRILAAAAGVITATAPLFLYFAVEALSELPFALLFLAALWGLETTVRSPTVSLSRQVLLGVLLALPFLCRSIGLALLPAGLVILLRARCPVRGVVVGAMLTVAPWLAWTVAGWGGWQRDPVQGYYTDYLGWWSGTGEAGWAVRVVVQNLGALIWSVPRIGLEGIGQLLGQGAPGFLWPALLLFLGLVMWGAVLRSLVRSRGLAIGLVAYCLVVAVWPWQPLRFLVPVLPAFLAYLLLGLAAMTRRWAGQKGLGFAAGAALAVVVAANLGLLGQQGGFVRQAGLNLATPAPIAWTSYEDVFAWLRTNSQEDDVIACGLDPMIYLYTGRPAFRPFVHRPLAMFYGQEGPAVGTADDLEQLLQTRGASYLVHFPLPSFAEERAFAAVVEQLRARPEGPLQLVYQGEDPRFLIFEVRSGNRLLQSSPVPDLGFRKQVDLEVEDQNAQSQPGQNP